MMSKNALLALYISGLTLFSIFVFPGYRVMDADQRLYMAAFTYEDVPGNFQNDVLFPYVQFQHTYFDELVRGGARVFNGDLFVVFFVLSLAARALYYWAVYRIAWHFTSDQLFSWLIPIVFLGGMSVYGAAVRTLDTELVPRLLGMALCLAFLALWLNRQSLPATLALSAATALHPITALPWLLFFGVASLVELWRDRREWFFWMLLLFMPVLALWSLHPLIGQTGLMLRLDPEWEAIFRERISYAFLTEWSARDQRWAHVGVSIILFGISLRELRQVWQRDRRLPLYYILLFTIPVGLAAISFIGLDVLKIQTVAQWQLLRSLVLWRIFIALFFSYFAYQEIKIKNTSFVYVASLFGILYSFFLHEYVVFLFFPIFLYEYIRRRWYVDRFKSFFFLYIVPSLIIVGILTALNFLVGDIGTAPVVRNVWLSLPVVLVGAVVWQWRHSVSWAIAPVVVVGVLTVALFIPRFSMYPSYATNPATTELCEWVKANTSPTAVFLTQPFSDEDDWFRPACQRSVFTTRKDGGQVLFRDRDFAIEWHRRIRYVQSVDTDPTRLITQTPPASFDYVLSATPLPVSAPVIFQNSEYIVYELVPG